MTKICNQCDYSVNGNTKYCPKCGAPIIRQSSLEDSISKRICNFLDSKGRHYQLFLDGKLIKLNYNLKNAQSINCFIHAIEEKSEIHLRILNYINISNNKKSGIFSLCSQMNRKYNWVKFYVDEKDNSVTVACDALVEPDTCEQICLFYLYRIVTVADSVYPEFLRTLYN